MRKQLTNNTPKWLFGICALAGCADAQTPSPEASGAVQTLSASALAAAAGSGAITPSVSGIGAGLALPEAKPSRVLTERIGQLTGAPPNDYAGLDMSGTDLGISFPIGDQLFFLFGDTLIPGWKPNDRPDLNLDSIASTSRERPSGSNAIPVLRWVTRPAAEGGTFQPFVVPDTAPLRQFSVPVEGINIDSRVYLFFHVTPETVNGSTDELMRLEQAESVLAHVNADANGRYDFTQLVRDETIPQDNFRSVSVVRDGDKFWIYGAATYRRSPVWLARATTETLAQRSQWEYFSAYDPTLEDGINTAGAMNPVVADSCVGELSVRKHPTRDLYFMAYNCGESIRFRFARHPAGPWSDAEELTSNAEVRNSTDNFLGDNSNFFNPEVLRNDEPIGRGALYGPYMIPEWFTDTADGNIDIVYTLSSFVPYEIQLMHSVVSIPPATASN